MNSTQIAIITDRGYKHINDYKYLKITIVVSITVKYNNGNETEFQDLATQTPHRALQAAKNYEIDESSDLVTLGGGAHISLRQITSSFERLVEATLHAPIKCLHRSRGTSGQMVRR